MLGWEKVFTYVVRYLPELELSVSRKYSNMDLGLKDRAASCKTVIYAGPPNFMSSFKFRPGA